MSYKACIYACVIAVATVTEIIWLPKPQELAVWLFINKNKNNKKGPLTPKLSE